MIKVERDISLNYYHDAVPPALKMYCGASVDVVDGETFNCTIRNYF